MQYSKINKEMIVRLQSARASNMPKRKGRELSMPPSKWGATEEGMRRGHQTQRNKRMKVTMPSLKFMEEENADDC